MIGRTNVGGNAPASLWYAYIQVSTDANAVITAVNPAGNSYTKTADSTGSAIFIVSYPGTYTISETDAPSQTVVVADYGVVYPVSIYLPTFNGILISDGSEAVSFTTAGKEWSSYGGVAPSVSNQVITVSGNSYNVRYVYETSGKAGIYITEDAYDVSTYSELVIIGYSSVGTNYFCLLNENTLDVVKQNTMLGSFGTKSLSLSDVDKTKKYRVGVWALGNNIDGARSYINNLKFQ